MRPICTVNVESYGRLVELCQAVWAVAPEAEANFLQDACRDDCHLRQQVEAMLDADRRAGRFLCDAPIDLVSMHLLHLQRVICPVTGWGTTRYSQDWEQAEWPRCSWRKMSNWVERWP